jgi:hypothetical protein
MSQVSATPTSDSGISLTRRLVKGQKRIVLAGGVVLGGSAPQHCRHQRQAVVKEVWMQTKKIAALGEAAISDTSILTDDSKSISPEIQADFSESAELEAMNA